MIFNGYLLPVVLVYAFFFFMELSVLAADEELSSEAESDVSDIGVPSPAVQAPLKKYRQIHSCKKFVYMVKADDAQPSFFKVTLFLTCIML